MDLPTGNIGDSVHASNLPRTAHFDGGHSPTAAAGDSVPEKAFSFAQSLSFWYVRLFLVLSSLSLVIVSSMVFYWLVYFLLIPPRLYTYPSNLHGDCFNITLSDRQWMSDYRQLAWDRPAVSVEFDVSLMLSIPMVSNLDHRQQATVNASLISESGRALATYQTQWLPPQLSSFAILVRNIAYAYPAALGLVYESWEADIPLFTSFPLLLEEASDPL